MRFVGLAVALLALGACEQIPGKTGIVRADGTATLAQQNSDPALATPNAAYDYRYAFRLAGSRIAPVQESHARGCDSLGPSRCRITAMRYKVGDDNKISAILTLKLDPSLARMFGKAAGETVTGAGGVLTDAEIAGADSLAATGRTDTVLARLRDALENVSAQQRGGASDDKKSDLAARADRLRAAIATINEVDQDTGTSVATAPVIFTYSSGGPIPGLGGSADASFDTAGETFLSSVAGLAVVLASVGPWALLLIGGALILRRIVQGDPDAAPAPAIPPAPREEGPKGNVLQRWFGRDEAREPEHAE